MKLLGLLLAISIFITGFAKATSNHVTLEVPSQYPTVAAAVNKANQDPLASNYYVINAQPGTYLNDFPTVNHAMTIQRDLTKTGFVVMQATVPLPNQKGIILTNANLTVTGLRLTGAWIDNSLGGNGAGIRDQNMSPNAKLVVIGTQFDGNQEGILTGYNPAQTVQLSWVKVKNNGNPDPNWWQHGIYIGGVKSLSVDNSVFCGQLIGHEIKSRAASTTITKTKIYDGATDTADGCRASSASYAIDTPNGGVVSISSNTIVQGPDTQNNSIIAYGEEGMKFTTNSMSVANNTINSSGVNATGIFIPNCPVKVENLSTNTITGVNTVINPAGCIQ